jgi:hypothetical protein
MRMHLIVVCLLGAGMPALGQDDEAPLAGPSVAESPGATSLVHVGYDGAIERPDVPVEEAALELLDLDEATRARVEDILAARAAILDKAVIENIDLLVQLRSAKSAGDKAQEVSLLGRFARELAPLRARGTLREEIGAALDETNLATFEALIDEYDEAIVAEARESAKQRGETFQVRRFARAERLKDLGREIRRSYERQIGSRREDFERLLAALDLTPEHEAKVRQIVTDFAQRTKLNPTRKDRAGVYLEILSVLSAEERSRLAAYVRGERGGGAPAREAPDSSGG